jgi:restriction system protein
MALWLVRAGKSGQHEQRFIHDKNIYLTWEALDSDLSKIATREQLRRMLENTFPNASAGRITQNSGQVWAFAKRMNPGDWVAMPSKHTPSIHIGEITGPYRYDPKADANARHARDVRWIELDVPRTNFDQDLLYSLGAFSGICEVKRNNAEERIRAMQKSGWKSTHTAVTQQRTGKIDSGPLPEETEIDDAGDMIDLEQQARDQITRFIIAKFKGHGLAMLVRRVLEAQGYTVHQPPEGPDRGIDLLAAPGPLGFGTPKICVQVKSQESPIERVVLDQLLGTMSNVQADRGLLVSWGGFKGSLKREEAQQFFRVRLWDSADLIEQIFSVYDKLPDELRAELPLKRLWSLSLTEDE